MPPRHPASFVARRFLRTRPSAARRLVDRPSATPVNEPPESFSGRRIEGSPPIAKKAPLSQSTDDPALLRVPFPEPERQSLFPQSPSATTSPTYPAIADPPYLPGLTKYAYRWHTSTPTPEQLARADKFFTKIPAEHVWTQSKFREIERGNAPEVAFLGRSNVGKSSLLNALLNNKGLAFTSSKPGRTRAMSAFSVCGGKLLLLDMPGYGKGSQAEWGTQIMKYLHGRKQLRRSFILLDSDHGAKQADMLLLEAIAQADISYQLVLSKIDRVKEKDLRGAFEKARFLMESDLGGRCGLGEILAVAADPKRKGEKKKGISELRWATMVAAGLERWGLK